MIVGRRRFSPRYRHSVWDRLTNPDLVPREDVGITEEAEIRKVKEQVYGDLLVLLNSRRAIVEIPEGMPALRKSLLMFGLPDLTGRSPGHEGDRKVIEAAIRQVIDDFEPRLGPPLKRDARDRSETVEVECLPVGPGSNRAQLSFRISATLRLNEVPISFNYSLDVASWAFFKS